MIVVNILSILIGKLHPTISIRIIMIDQKNIKIRKSNGSVVFDVLSIEMHLLAIYSL